MYESKNRLTAHPDHSKIRMASFCTKHPQASAKQPGLPEKTIG